MGPLLFYISGFMLIFWFSMTVYSMTILSVHNYYAIVKPMFARARNGCKIASRLLLLAIFMSFLISVSSIGFDEMTFDPAIAQCTTLRIEGKKVIFSTVLAFTLCYVLPTCINVF